MYTLLKQHRLRWLGRAPRMEDGQIPKGDEIRDTKNLNLSRNIVSLLVFGRCFPLLSEKDFPEKRPPCLFTFGYTCARTLAWTFKFVLANQMRV